MMNARIWTLILVSLVWMSACTRPYSTAPFPENLGFKPEQSVTVSEASPTQSGTEATQAIIPTEAIPNTAAGEETAEDKTTRSLFILQSGTPVWLENVLHPEAECNWMGVAGQVFDAQSNPITDLVMTVGGTLNGEVVDRVSLTGIAPQYGEGGYEVFLGERPIASRQTLWIQIRDLEGKQLTDKVYFDTIEDCERNLIIMNFVQASTGEITNYFLPIVRK
jgi:hypothetical protein